MSNVEIIFYVLAASMIMSGALAVTSRRILRAAVYLLFSLTAIAGTYFLMDFFFLAAVQIIVYIGGIVVLIIFSIMLTHRIEHKLKAPSITKSLIALIASVVGCGICLFTIWTHPFPMASGIEPITDIEHIGTTMLTYGEGGYILPFELISVLLLAAMIAVIVIAKRTEPLNS